MCESVIRVGGASVLLIVTCIDNHWCNQGPIADDDLLFLIKGTAYVHGVKHATGNFIIIMDADLSHHVSGASLFGCSGCDCLLPA